MLCKAQHPGWYGEDCVILAKDGNLFTMGENGAKQPTFVSPYLQSDPGYPDGRGGYPGATSGYGFPFK